MNKRLILFLLGIIITLFSIILYIKHSPYWILPIGIFLIFDFISFKLNNHSTSDLSLKSFLRLYYILFIAGILIEFIGMFVFDLWSYKMANYSPTISAFLTMHIEHPLTILGWIIGYPFILMFLKESYSIAKKISKNSIIATIIAMFIGIIIWEIPNIYSKDWIYVIPYVNFEIFHINIIVIIGWVILIQGPNLIYKSLNIK